MTPRLLAATRPLLALTALLALLGGPAHAQTLSLSPAVTTASVGDTVVFTVFLSDGTNDTSNLGAYDFTLSVDNQYLSFVAPSSPLTLAAGSSFSTLLTNSASNVSGVMHTSYATDAVTVVNEEGKGPLSLGTFSVSVLKALPVVGSALTFSVVGTGPGQSSVLDASTFGNVLQGTLGGRVLPLVVPAPEPCGWCVLCLGMTTLLGMTMLRAAKRPMSTVKTCDCNH